MTLEQYLNQLSSNGSIDTPLQWSWDEISHNKIKDAACGNPYAILSLINERIERKHGSDCDCCLDLWVQEINIRLILCPQANYDKGRSSMTSKEIMLGLIQQLKLSARPCLADVDCEAEPPVIVPCVNETDNLFHSWTFINPVQPLRWIPRNSHYQTVLRFQLRDWRLL